MTPFQWLVRYLAASGAASLGKNWQCPAHEDATPSLNVSEAADGRILVHCFAGCEPLLVLESLGLHWHHLFEAPSMDPRDAWRASRRRITYPAISCGPVRGSSPARRRGMRVATELHYYTESARLRRERYDTGKKEIRWEARKGGDWYFAEGLRLDLLPLYRQEEARAGLLVGEEVVLCESESSVDALMGSGIYATTWAGGATSIPMARLVDFFESGRVLMVPDNDAAGLRALERLRSGLRPHVTSWREMLPEPGQDARDLLNEQGHRAFLEAMHTM